MTMPYWLTYLKLTALGVLLFFVIGITCVACIVFLRCIVMHKGLNDTVRYCKMYKWTILLVVTITVLFWGLHMGIRIPCFSIIETGLFVIGTTWVARGVLPALFT